MVPGIAAVKAGQPALIDVVMIASRDHDHIRAHGLLLQRAQESRDLLRPSFRRDDDDCSRVHKTIRVRGHYEGDRQQYRTDGADGVAIPRDPVLLLREHIPAEVADELDRRARTQVDDAFTGALAAARPDPSIVLEDVWA